MREAAQLGEGDYLEAEVTEAGAIFAASGKRYRVLPLLGNRIGFSRRVTPVRRIRRSRNRDGTAAIQPIAGD
jgi:hypothetical protein